MLLITELSLHPQMKISFLNEGNVVAQVLKKAEMSGGQKHRKKKVRKRLKPFLGGE